MATQTVALGSQRPILIGALSSTTKNVANFNKYMSHLIYFVANRIHFKQSIEF